MHNKGKKQSFNKVLKLDRTLLIIFFFSYIDGVSIFRSDIFTIATNRIMAPVIHRTKPSTVSCHSGTDTPLGRRSLVIVRERPQTLTCTYTHTGEHTQQFSVQELYKGENSFVSFIQPE